MAHPGGPIKNRIFFLYQIVLRFMALSVMCFFFSLRSPCVYESSFLLLFFFFEVRSRTLWHGQHLAHAGDISGEFEFCGMVYQNYCHVITYISRFCVRYFVFLCEGASVSNWGGNWTYVWRVYFVVLHKHAFVLFSPSLLLHPTRLIISIYRPSFSFASPHERKEKQCTVVRLCSWQITEWAFVPDMLQ